jgi:predicted transcriptional regulator
MTILSLREAAQAANVSRQTIYRYSKSGKLSTVLRDDGTKGVDTAELARVFGALRDPETVTETDKTETGDSHQRQALQGELEATRRALAIAEGALAQANERESRLLEVIERQTRLLEHRAPETPSDAPQHTAPKPVVTKKELRGASKKKLRKLLKRLAGETT